MSWNILQVDHMLDHKTSLGKLKKIEIVSRIFSDHYEIRNQLQGKKDCKHTNIWKLNNMLLNNQWLTEEIKEGIKNTWRRMKMKTQ